jgi:Protein of unknown function (DUF3592)
VSGGGLFRRRVSEGGGLSHDRPLAAVAAGILIFVIGLVLGVWAFEQARAEQDRLSIAARAEGTVSGHVNGRPQISFVLPSGDRMSFTARNVGRDDYPVGKKVDVLYRRDLPSDAVVDRPRARRARNALLGSLAIAAMALGAYVSWYARNYDARGARRE